MQKEKIVEKKELMRRILFEERKILNLVYFPILIHGLIHLLGFLVYWQIVEGSEDLTYKTTVFFEMLDVGSVGIRIFGIIWLLTAIGYIIVVIGLIVQKYNGVRKSLAFITVISLFITVLDFTVAYTGAMFNVIVLAGIAFLTEDTKQGIMSLFQEKEPEFQEKEIVSDS